MILINEKNGETVTIERAFYNKDYYLENIEFADGTIWDRKTLEKMFQISSMVRKETISFMEA